MKLIGLLLSLIGALFMGMSSNNDSSKMLIAGFIVVSMGVLLNVYGKDS